MQSLGFLYNFLPILTLSSGNLMVAAVVRIS